MDSRPEARYILALSSSQTDDRQPVVGFLLLILDRCVAFEMRVFLAASSTTNSFNLSTHS